MRNENFQIEWRGYCEFNLSLYKWNYLYYIRTLVMGDDVLCYSALEIVALLLFIIIIKLNFNAAEFN